jgi:hypothetical protein
MPTGRWVNAVAGRPGLDGWHWKSSTEFARLAPAVEAWDGRFSPGWILTQSRLGDRRTRPVDAEGAGDAEAEELTASHTPDQDEDGSTVAGRRVSLPAGGSASAGRRSPLRVAGRSLAVAALCAGPIAGCGGSGHPQTTSTQKTTTVSQLISPKESDGTTTPALGVTSEASPTSTTTTTTTPLPALPTLATPSDTGFVAAIDRPFSSSSPWNTSIASAPVDPRSNALIAAAQLRLGVQQGTKVEALTLKRRLITAPLYINTVKWTTPVLDADAPNAVSTTLLCRQPNLPPPDNLCGDGYLVPSLKIPPDVAPLPQYDGWLTVIDASAGYAYDLWRARRAANGAATMSYLYMRRWSLAGSGYLPPTAPSARGSGLPLFAGIITPEDIEAGVIRHALAISVPGPASINFVQPASLTDGNGAASSLPEGARLRLKASVTLASLLRALPGGTDRRASTTIYTALRTYGAIVVDRSAVPTLYAQLTTGWTTPLRDSHGITTAPDGTTELPADERNNPRYVTPLLRGTEVTGLRLSDFEVVRLPTLLKDPPIDNGDTRVSLPGVAPQALPGGTAGTAPSSTAIVPGTDEVPLTPVAPATPGA